MRYNFENKQRVVDSCSTMIRKLYPDFYPEKQYCFWIIADIWDGSPWFHVDGSVTLYDKDDHEIPLSEFGYTDKMKPLIRTPYYNKGIRQVGVKYGRKRVFGLPLVVDDYTKLEAIQKVHIHWDVLFPMFWLKNHTCITTVDSVYHVSFDFADTLDNHFFTLEYQDKFWAEDESYKDDAFHWYDIAAYGSGREMKKLYDTAYGSDNAFWSFCFSDVHKNMSDEEKSRIVDVILRRDMKPALAAAEKSMREFVHNFYWHEKHVVLHADPHPDLIPEEGFGFQ